MRTELQKPFSGSLQRWMRGEEHRERWDHIAQGTVLLSPRAGFKSQPHPFLEFLT